MTLDLPVGPGLMSFFFALAADALLRHNRADPLIATTLACPSLHLSLIFQSSNLLPSDTKESIKYGALLSLPKDHSSRLWGSTPGSGETEPISVVNREITGLDSGQRVSGEYQGMY